MRKDTCTPTFHTHTVTVTWDGAPRDLQRHPLAHGENMWKVESKPSDLTAQGHESSMASGWIPAGSPISMDLSENETLERFYHCPALEGNMKGEIHSPWITLCVPRGRKSWKPECGVPSIQPCLSMGSHPSDPHLQAVICRTGFDPNFPSLPFPLLPPLA